MKTMAMLTVVVALGGACAADEELSAEDELLLTAVSGEEEGAAEGDMSGPPTSEDRDIDRPMMGRVCDAQATLDRVLGLYDRDGDRRLSEDERDSVHAARGARGRFVQKHRRMKFKMLSKIYDGDRNGELDESERGELLHDFTIRCQAIHARLLGEFDANEDGALDDAELQALRETIAERRRARFAERPSRDEMRERMRARRAALKARFDENGDGELSDEEFAALREFVRERVRSGAHFFFSRDDEESASDHDTVPLVGVERLTE